MVAGSLAGCNVLADWLAGSMITCRWLADWLAGSMIACRWLAIIRWLNDYMTLAESLAQSLYDAGWQTFAPSLPRAEQ